ncbi:MAG: ADP-ribosylation factor protein 3 [Sclerophora amabilis]|nr:MAG: ADP-ribosylation factor protein 3 [Sclerophora amabilis]
MYHLMKGIYLYATSKEEYSLLLLGLDNAGKTTLLNQIKALYGSSVESSSAAATAAAAAAGSPEVVGKTVPTVGQNVSTISLPDVYLKIWDIGGQHSLRSLWHSYYASCHAIIFVIDSTDIGDLDVEGGGGGGGGGGGDDGHRHGHSGRAADEGGSSSTGRLEECRLVLEDVLKHSDAVGVPVLVLANKQDREDCVEVVRVKEGLVRKVFEGESGGRGVRDSRVLPVSALTGTGVKEAVEWVRTRVRWNKEARPPLMR